MVVLWPFCAAVRAAFSGNSIDQNEDLKERKNTTKYLSPSEHVWEEIFSRRPTSELRGEILRFSPYGELQTRRYFANLTEFIQVDVEPDD